MTAPLTRRERFFRVAAVALLGIFLAIFAAFPRLNPFSFCGFNVLTGLPCPFCGGTRAARALLRGDWATALYLNPLAIGLFAFALAFVLITILEAALGRALADWNHLWDRSYRRILIVFLAGVLIWWPIHLSSALRKPKPELVDLHNPVASTMRVLVQRHEK
jgi:hypothetical protein